MEPRARAGKNAGKMSFNTNELSQILYAHGDVRAPLPETVRALDEILTDFIQSVAFDAARAGQYAGRQKLKFEDFEFALRKNPTFLGKVQEVFEKKADIERAKKAFEADDVEVAKDTAGGGEKKGGKGGATGGSGSGSGGGGVVASDGGGGGGGGGNGAGVVKTVEEDEELGDADDDAQAEADALGPKRD